MEFLSAPEIRKLAEQVGFSPKKSFGQNFLLDSNVVRSIVDKAHIDASDVVLEIGPGFGSLTLGLLEVAKNVIAVEISPALAELLPETVLRLAPDMKDKLQVICLDALEVEDLPIAPTALVANLPYNVSVPILLHLLKTFPSISSGLVMVQSEVADRLVSAPARKTYGIPSVKLAWYAKARKVGDIGRKVFWPAPNVDSALVYFERHPTPLADVDSEELFELIDLAFSSRRKMLRSVLSSWIRSDSVFEQAGINPTVRGEALGVLDFVQLLQANKGGNT